MRKRKVAVTLDSTVLVRLDRLVRESLFPNRSQAVETAIMEKIDRIEHRRLAEECAKLDPASERSLAEEGLARDAAEWPDY